VGRPRGDRRYDMGEQFMDLEAIIEEELLEPDPGQEHMLGDNYGLEIDENYLLDAHLLEVHEAIERCHDSFFESNDPYYGVLEQSPGGKRAPDIQESHGNQQEQIRYIEPGAEHAPEEPLVIIINPDRRG